MASTIQLKTGTGSAVPSSLTQGEVAINIDNGLVYYGSGSTNTTKQLDSFTNITASGNISASGNILVTGNVDIDARLIVENSLTVNSGHISSSNIVLGTSADSILKILNNDASTTHELHGRGNVHSYLAVPTLQNLGIGLGTTTTPSSKLHVEGDTTVDGNITASGNISSSGNLISDKVHANVIAGKVDGTGIILGSESDIHVTASGNISASGTIIGLNAQIHGNSFVDGKLGVNAQTQPPGVFEVTGDSNFIGNITASGNISASGNLDLTGNANIDGNLDVDGTTNLDVVDVDGEFTIANDTKIRGEQANGTARDIIYVSDGNRLFLGSTSLGTTVQASAANMTLDSAGNIKLDSDTGDIQFQDGTATSIYINSTEGNITASGNISASGNIDASIIDAQSSLRVKGNRIVYSNDDISFPDTGLNVSGGNITASGDISASGNIYSNNIEILAQGSARVSSITNTTDYWGPNFQGPYHTANWNRNVTPEANGNVILERQKANSGFIVPYSCSLVGFDAIGSMNTGENTHFSMSLFTADALTGMNLNISDAAAGLFTASHATTGISQGNRGTNRHRMTGSCAVSLSPFSVVFPLVKIDAAGNDDGAMSLDMTYVLKIKRIK